MWIVRKVTSKSKNGRERRWLSITKLLLSIKEAEDWNYNCSKDSTLP